MHDGLHGAAPRSRRAGLAFLVGAGLLGLLLVANTAVLDKAAAPVARRDVHITATPAVAALTLRVWVEPGDLLRVAPSALAQGKGVEMYAVEAQGPLANATGLVPASAYAHRAAPQWEDPVSIWRPEPGPAARALGIGPAFPLDVVWMVRLDPDAPVPHEAELLLAMAACHQPPFPCRGAVAAPYMVLDGGVLATQGVFYAVEAASALFAIGAGVTWWRQRAREGAAAGAGAAPDSTEGLLRLTASAGSYLRGLLTILHLLGVLLVLFFFLGGLGILFLTKQAAAHGPTLLWPAALLGGLGLVYASMVAVWLRYTLDVSRELKRWRTQAAQPPLDL